MKTKKYISILTVVFLLCIGTISVKAENSLSELSEIKGVEYIYISESMLNSMGGKAPIDMLSAISELRKVEILSCESSSSIQKVKSTVPKIVKGFELVSKVKDEEESISFYGIKSGKHYSELLLIIEESDEIVIIKLKGKIDASALKELID